MGFEISPEGAIAIRKVKRLGRRQDIPDQTKEYISGLTSKIASINLEKGFDREQTDLIWKVRNELLNLSEEKPNIIRLVFEEILPGQFPHRKKIAREMSSLLKNPPDSPKKGEEKINALFNNFPGKDRELIEGLSTVFQQTAGGQGQSLPGLGSGWGGAASAPEGPRRRDARVERAGRVIEAERRRAVGLVLHEIRSRIIWPIVAVIVGGSILTASEAKSNVRVSPLSHFFEKERISVEPFGEKVIRVKNPLNIYEKPERQLWVRPFTERALSGTSDYTINEWYGAIYNTQDSRKNVLDPHKYDDDAKMYIEEADKKLKDVPSDQIAQTLGERGIYQNPVFHDGLAWAEGVITAWREHKTIDPQDAQHFRDNYFVPEVGFAWPEKIPSEE